MMKSATPGIGAVVIAGLVLLLSYGMKFTAPGPLIRSTEPGAGVNDPERVLPPEPHERSSELRVDAAQVAGPGLAGPSPGASAVTHTEDAGTRNDSAELRLVPGYFEPFTKVPPAGDATDPEILRLPLFPGSTPTDVRGRPQAISLSPYLKGAGVAYLTPLPRTRALEWYRDQLVALGYAAGHRGESAERETLQLYGQPNMKRQIEVDVQSTEGSSSLVQLWVSEVSPPPRTPASDLHNVVKIKVTYKPVITGSRPVTSAQITDSRPVNDVVTAFNSLPRATTGLSGRVLFSYTATLDCFTADGKVTSLLVDPGAHLVSSDTFAFADDSWAMWKLLSAAANPDATSG